MTLWTATEAVAATGGRTQGDWIVNGVSIDTREISEGDLFVALKDIRDGHDFVAQALEKGAAAALVSHVPEGVATDSPLLVVPDVLAALEDLARAARKRMSGKVIGVTGSVGKTGSKEMLRTMLSAVGKTHAAERSFNNHWGVPLTLARMPQDTAFAVIEIGMNHPNEITPLAILADLDVALVTTVAAVHMEAFESIEQIAHAKAEIVDGLRKDGTLVFNADIETHDILQTAAQGVGVNFQTFGKSDDADYHLLSAELETGGTRVKAQVGTNSLDFIVPAPGQHLAMNALGCLAVAHAAGADISVCANALKNWQTPDGRGAQQTLHTEMGTIRLIDESYNANPTSMSAALWILAQSEGRKIAILGDMLELGDQETLLHSGLAEDVSIAQIDVVHCVGPRMKALFEALPINKRGHYYETADVMAETVHKTLEDGDVIMIKGSNGSRVSKIVTTLRNLEV